MRIILLLNIAVSLAIGGQALANIEPVETRFGILSSGDDRLLRLDGRVVTPSLSGNSSLSFIKLYQLRGRDVAIVQDVGGIALPAQFYFVTLTARTVKAAGPYGTGSDRVTVSRRGETIALTMPGFLGPFEPVNQQEAASRERHVFRFSARAHP